MIWLMQRPRGRWAASKTLWLQIHMQVTAAKHAALFPWHQHIFVISGYWRAVAQWPCVVLHTNFFYDTFSLEIRLSSSACGKSYFFLLWRSILTCKYNTFKTGWTSISWLYSTTVITVSPVVPGSNGSRIVSKHIHGHKTRRSFAVTDNEPSSSVNTVISVDGFAFQLQESYYLLKRNIIHNNKGAHLKEIQQWLPLPCNN